MKLRAFHVFALKFAKLIALTISFRKLISFSKIVKALLMILQMMLVFKSLAAKSTYESSLFLTALLAFVPRQRSFPYVLLTACVADVFVAVLSVSELAVLVFAVIWK